MNEYVVKFSVREKGFWAWIGSIEKITILKSNKYHEEIELGLKRFIDSLREKES